MAGRKYDQYMAVNEESDEGMEWHSADETPFVLEGLAWREKGGDFERMPKVPLPEGVVRFGRHSAGVQLRFKTDSSVVMVKASLETMDNAADIMTFSRICFDVYLGGPLDKRYSGVTRLNFDEVREHKCSYCASVFRTRRKAMREFTLNFPLYARIEDFALGLEPASKIEAPSPRLDSRPIVVYGTSIQQGCAASRPGLCHTNMLSRLLDRPFINLGFAGSGKGEPEVARVLATIKNPALYILDYDSNSSMESLEATLPGFTDILREAHPETPVLTVSQMRYPSESPDCPDEPLCCESRIRRTEIHVANMRRRRALSDNMVHFLDGIDLYGPEDFGECTIDGCHANDLGYYRISKAMAPEIRRILSQAV